jgi:excisionase family DNA binding protein
MKLSTHQIQEPRVLLSLPEAAAALAIGRNTLLGLIERGELPTVRIGRSVRIPVSALETWAERNQSSQKNTVEAAA